LDTNFCHALNLVKSVERADGNRRQTLQRKQNRKEIWMIYVLLH